MQRIFLVSHKKGYHGYEDYVNSLRCTLSTLYNNLEIIVVVYEQEQSIPDERQSLYFFLNYITPHFFNLFITNQNLHIYLINTEQVTRHIWDIISKHYMEKGVTILDYDLYQTSILQKIKFNSQIHYLPYQITKNETERLRSLITQSTKSYDVAFCTTNHSRKRLSLYNQLENLGFQLVDANGWGDVRDRKIAQSKILVNIHFDKDYQIFEHMRCDRWILSGMLIVSESSLSDELFDCRDLLIIDKYENLAQVVTRILANYQYYYAQYLEKLKQYSEMITDQRISLCQKICGETILGGTKSHIATSE